MPSIIAVSTGSVWRPTTSPTRHRRIARSMGLKRPIWLPLFLAVVLFSNLSKAAINLIYCSPENTGEGSTPYFYDYQSNGECYNYCVDDYAYAVVMYKDCWCSNYPPLEQKDLELCSSPCPGYPDDKCGNRKLRYYNYIELPAHVPSSRTDEISSTTTSSDSSHTDAPITTNAPTPIISVTTIQGSQKTVTITPTASESTGTSFSVNSTPNQNFFSNAGRVAGVFVGIFIALLALVALLIWFFKRKNDRRNSLASSHHNPEMGMSGSGTSPSLGTGNASPTNRPRSTSTLGLAGAFSQEKAPAITTTGFTEAERMTDQRLDPNQIWMRFNNENSSRVSLRSLQDNQDYSRRVLKLTNPDN